MMCSMIIRVLSLLLFRKLGLVAQDFYSSRKLACAHKNTRDSLKKTYYFEILDYLTNKIHDCIGWHLGAS